MNDIMRFRFSCTPLLDMVLIYFLYILEDNRELLENSDSDDDSGPEMNCGSGLQMNCGSGPQMIFFQIVHVVGPVLIVLLLSV